MQFKRLALLVPTCIVILILSSCTMAPEKTFGLPDLEANMWNEFAGGGDTKCADGSDYKYYAYEGEQNKVVIDFQGGGACWDAGTCSAPQFFYTNSVNGSPTDNQYDGIYNRDNAANPVKDWFHVFAPYCTGDIHTGNNDKQYTNPQDSTQNFTIYHRGAVNAQAVLDWTFDKFEKPEAIFVTGCSAGAYGAMAWTETIRKHYGAEVPLYQLGDCGAGISTPAFSSVLEQAWGVANVDALNDRPFTSTFTEDTYIATATKYPDVKLAQYNTTRDSTQVGFYSFGKGLPSPSVTEVIEWSSAMQASMAKIEGAVSNYSSYVAEHGADPTTTLTQHCVINRPDMYQVSENGTSLITWITDLVSGNAVSSVAPPPPAIP